MSAAVDKLVRLLADNGLGPWVRDDMGIERLANDWAADVVDALTIELQAAIADPLGRLQDELDEKPNRKTISVSKLRAILHQT